MGRTLIAMEMALVVSKLLLFAAMALQAVPEADLQNEESDQPVYPKVFRGVWAQTVEECKSNAPVGVVRIARSRIYGYESDSSLLIITPVNHHGTPANEEALTVVALVAERGEMEVGTGKLRISRVGNRLYMSRETDVDEDEHFKPEFSNVRCAD